MLGERTQIGFAAHRRLPDGGAQLGDVGGDFVESGGVLGYVLPGMALARMAISATTAVTTLMMLSSASE